MKKIFPSLLAFIFIFTYFNISISKAEDYSSLNKSLRTQISDLNKQINADKKKISKIGKKYLTKKKSARKAVNNKLTYYKDLYNKKNAEYVAKLDAANNDVENAEKSVNKASKQNDMSKLDKYNAQLDEAKNNLANIQDDMIQDMQIYSDYITTWQDKSNELNKLNLTKVNKFYTDIDSQNKIIKSNNKSIKNTKSDYIKYSYNKIELDCVTKKYNDYEGIYAEYLNLNKAIDDLLKA